jgi:hypothetical protein
MKKLILPVLVLFLLAGCKDKNVVVSYPNFVSVGPDSIIFLLPDATMQLNANQPVTWITTSGGGTVNTSGIYTAPTSPGAYTIKVVALADTNLKKNIKAIVSTDAQLYSDIRKGGFNLVFRHAQATTGSDTGLPNATSWDHTSCDATIVRQLDNPAGVTQATEIGMALRNIGVKVDTTYSSEFCRCKTTMQFMNLGAPIITTPNLTYYPFNSSLESQRYTKTYAMAQIAPRNGTIKVLGTHVQTTGYPAGDPLGILGQGDAAVYRFNTMGVASFVKIITSATWRLFK